MSSATCHVLHFIASQAVGLLTGVGLGYLKWYWLPSRKDTHMNDTGSVRIRDLVVGVILVVLCGYSLHLASVQGHQRDCLRSYIASNSQTQTIRSGLVSVESQATRNVILSTLNATTKNQVIAAREEYKRMLNRIDAGRDANPVRPFNEGRCE